MRAWSRWVDACLGKQTRLAAPSPRACHSRGILDTQGYCVVPADKRFLLLFTFLKKNAKKKVPSQAS